MSDVSLSTSVACASGVLAQTLDDEIVLLDPNLGHYFVLNSTGARLWEWMAEAPTTVDALVGRLTAEYDIDRPQAERDVLELVHRLREQELVTVSGGDDRSTG